LLLIPYWAERQNYTALSQYLSYRVNLSYAVESLAADPTWQEYASSHSGAESATVAQLLKTQAVISGSEVAAANTGPNHSDGATDKNEASAPGAPQRAPKPRTSPYGDTDKPKPTAKSPPAQDQNHSPRTILAPPALPTGLQGHAMMAINFVPEIANLLGELNNSDRLGRSRQVSNFFDFSIVRWARKRNSLIYGNYISGVCTVTKDMSIPVKGKKSDYFVPQFDNEVLLNCLTIHSVRELAQFELPTVTNPTQLGGRIGREIEVSPNTLPRDAYLATIVVQLLLFFTLIHFGAYAREAVSSPTFPAPATLFGAFARSHWTLLVFLLALWSPLVASLGTATVSREWLLWVLSVPNVFAVYSAYRVLHLKSYFQPLYDRAWALKRPARDDALPGNIA